MQRSARHGRAGADTRSKAKESEKKRSRAHRARGRGRQKNPPATLGGRGGRGGRGLIKRRAVGQNPCFASFAKRTRRTHVRATAEHWRGNEDRTAQNNKAGFVQPFAQPLTETAINWRLSWARSARRWAVFVALVATVAPSCRDIIFRYLRVTRVLQRVVTRNTQQKPPKWKLQPCVIRCNTRNTAYYMKLS